MRYRLNSDGTKTPIAGRGKAEYGASTIRKGLATIPQFETGDPIAKNVQVTFDSPMPDTDYIVNLEELSSTNIYTLRVFGKTVNGFTIAARLAFATTTTVEQGPINSRSIYWKAFKLYTDTEYNNILAAMPSDAKDDNKLATVNDLPTLETVTINIPTYGGTAVFKKYGKVVQMSLSYVGSTTNIAKNSIVDLFSVPSGYEPRVNYTGVGTTSSSINSSEMRTVIATSAYPNASVYVYSNEAAITNGRVAITWIVG